MFTRFQQGRSDNDAMFVYTADDFSEESLQSTTFGIKFKDAEVCLCARLCSFCGGRAP